MNVDNLTLPVKREDEETLKERLTANAYENIIPARYLMEDEDGEICEEPEDLFKRVAKNVALAEVVYTAEQNDVDLTVTPEQVKPVAGTNKRKELTTEVFGEDTELDGEGEVTLTEENIYAFSYDSLYDGLPASVQSVLEQRKDQFQDLMEHLSFIPNSPTLMNAGDDLQQLSACFVNSPGDDMDSIHETAKEAAATFQSGGGMGYAFWKLRPYGDSVSATGGIASGPITFMRTYDQMCATIAQGGTRRGAQMGVMRVSHPDVIQFIHAKNKDVSLAETLRLNDPDDYTHNSFGDALEEARDLIVEDEEGNKKVPQHLRNAVEGHLSNFNISVGVTDDFMEAVKNDEDFTFTNPRTGEPHIATEYTKEMYGWFGLGDYIEVGEELSLPANVIWDRIIDGAHENGEPGVIYLERVNKRHSFDVEEHPDHEILATNPCGEQPLEEYEACNLGHINLSTLVAEEPEFQDWRTYKEANVPEDVSQEEYEDHVEAFLEQAIDWDEFNHRIEVGTRFLENVVTMSDFPVEEITEKVSEMRKIGLGVMGLAQLYIQLGVKYGSETGNEMANQLMTHINHESKQASHQLAQERGVFDEWSKSKYADPTEYEDWFEHHTGLDADEWEDGFEMRNHNTTTVAPTGTTSMVGNTTGGIEPIYNVAYYKNVSEDVQGDDMLIEFDDYFLRTLEDNDIDVQAVKEEAAEQMANNEFDGINGLSTVPDSIGELFVVTSDLTGRQHASVQCACQNGVDSSISKTCNFPNDASKEDMAEVYEYVYDNGGKGVTVYRDGTRSKQVLTTRADNAEFAEDEDVADYLTRMVDEGEVSVEEVVNALQSEFEVRVTDNQGQLGLSEYRKRPDALVGINQRINTGYGTLYVWISEDENGNMFEVFASIGKAGGYTQSFTEALCRMISMSLRYGVPPNRIVRHLQGIQSPKVGWENQEQVSSVADGIAMAMDSYLEYDGVLGMLSAMRDGDDELADQLAGNSPPSDVDVEAERTAVDEMEFDEGASVDLGGESEEAAEKESEGGSSTADLVAQGESPECPDCGAMDLYYSEGCKTCESCGWSEC